MGDEPRPHGAAGRRWVPPAGRARCQADTDGYPFTLPVVAQLAHGGGLELDPGVTFLVGDNGTGKSTLVEALAVAAGFNAEGGSQSFRFATRATESSLGDHLVLRWAAKPRTGFFLRAESFYNVATEIDRLDQESPTRCCPPTAAGHCTNAPTASPFWTS